MDENQKVERGVAGPAGLPRYDALLQSEETVRAATPSAAKPPIELGIRAVETLLTMSGYHGIVEADPESPDGAFHWWASERARQAPFSMRAFILLWDRGHYVECMSILRQLIESLAQLRYFHMHRLGLQAHLMAVGSKGRVQFRTMFEALSPGFYDRQYGRIFSSVAHSGMGLSAMLEHLPATNERLAQSVPRVQCEYHQMSAMFTANALALVATGFLKQYPTWFSGYQALATSDDMELFRSDVVKILDQFRGYLRTRAPSPDGYDLWDRLIE